MEFERRDAPFVTPSTDVGAIMRQVLYALIPAALAYVWYFGSGFIFNLIVAAVFCVGGEAAMLRLRGKPIESTLLDYSALVTAALIALALPPATSPALILLGVAAGLILGKHLYGGLGASAEVSEPARVARQGSLLRYNRFSLLDVLPQPRHRP